MRSAIGLGLRLAWGEGWSDGGRRRTVLLALACAIATATLVVAQRAAALMFSATPTYFPGFVDLAGPVLLIACAVIPALTLVAAAGRMAAESRERRLAALRLLGLAAGRVRLVAATELAVAGVVGVVLGGVAIDQAPWLGSALSGTGFSWPPGSISAPNGLGPHLLAAALVLFSAVAPTLFAYRGRSAAAMATVRRVPRAPRAALRVLPLVLGLALCLVAWRALDASGGRREAAPALLFAAGVALTALGVVTVVPLVVRLLGDVLVRVGKRRSAALVAGRRLQGQPAAANRVVATLLVALFLGTAAQATVAAQAGLANRWLTGGADDTQQILYVTRTDDIDALDRDPAILAEAPGVRQVARYAYLSACDAAGTQCQAVFVGTCAALSAIAPGVTGCVDGTAYRLRTGGPDPNDPRDPLPAAMTLRRPWIPNRDPVVPGEVTATLPMPSATLMLPQQPLERLDSLLLPPDNPQVAAMRSLEGRMVRIVADLGPATRDHLRAHGIGVEGKYAWQASEAVIQPQRTFTLGLTLFATVLGVIAFAIAYVDRLAERRAEVVGLQLLGAPRSVLRIGHLWEMATPLVVGSALAIGFGRLIGDLYLRLGWPAAERPIVPAGTTLAVVVAALAASVLLALLTAGVANPRVRPELIRTT